MNFYTVVSFFSIILNQLAISLKRKEKKESYTYEKKMYLNCKLLIFPELLL